MLNRNFVDTALMASTFKACAQERVNNLLCQINRDESCRNGANVGVVVLTGKSSYLGIPAQSRADALVFVGCNVDTVATSTKCYAQIELASLNRLGKRMGNDHVLEH